MLLEVHVCSQKKIQKLCLSCGHSDTQIVELFELKQNN